MNILILEDDDARIEEFKRRIMQLNDVDGQVYFTIVKHAQEAIDLLSFNEYDLLFLDHDLNGKQMQFDEEDCGTLVAKYLHDNPPEVELRIIIHSLNFPASKRMQGYLPSAVHIPFLWMDHVFSRTFNLAL